MAWVATRMDPATPAAAWAATTMDPEPPAVVWVATPTDLVIPAVAWAVTPMDLALPARRLANLEVVSEHGAHCTFKITRQLTATPDSTMGKLMEKAGGMFKNEKMEQKGAEKRNQAGGGYDDSSNNY